MSYEQAIKWQRKHPKGTRQAVIMSTGSGFWPSGGWLKTCYFPYLEKCKRQGTKPMGAEKYYKSQFGGIGP
jgi:hypothetical protein